MYVVLHGCRASRLALGAGDNEARYRQYRTEIYSAIHDVRKAGYRSNWRRTVDKARKIKTNFLVSVNMILGHNTARHGILSFESVKQITALNRVFCFMYSRTGTCQGDAQT